MALTRIVLPLFAKKKKKKKRKQMHAAGQILPHSWNSSKIQ
jgi:hypothetical protein